MKKIARCGLALAAVMSVSGSAMALLECPYDVESSTGIRKVKLGVMLPVLEELVVPDLYNMSCSYNVAWIFASPAAAASVARLRVLETNSFEDRDCFAATFYPTNAVITADPATRNQAIDQSGQVRALFSLHVVTDPENGVGVGLYKTSPLAAPKKIRLTPSQLHP